MLRLTSIPVPSRRLSTLWNVKKRLICTSSKLYSITDHKPDSLKLDQQKKPLNGEDMSPESTTRFDRCHASLKAETLRSESAKPDSVKAGPDAKGSCPFSKIPGVLAAVGVMATGFYSADVLGHMLLEFQGIQGLGGSPISGIPVSILLGMGLNNFLLPRFAQIKKMLAPGLALSSKLILQIGIICVGLKLSAVDVLALGGTVFPCVMLAIATGLSFTYFLSQRLGLPPRMGLLIGTGTSICGVTAITAMAPSLKANLQEVSFAVATVVGFGTFAMLTYPYFAHYVFTTPEQVGLFLGLAVHDTSQVIGSAMTYSQVYSDPVALQWATVTKLSRNMCLGFVIPILSTIYSRQQNPDSTATWFSVSELKKHLPIFVLGFLGMALVRTIGDATLASSGLALGLFEPSAWKSITNTIGGDIGTYLLGTAMAAVGLNTNFSVLKGVGIKPFVAGFGGALVMGLLGAFLALTLNLSANKSEVTSNKLEE